MNSYEAMNRTKPADITTQHATCSKCRYLLTLFYFYFDQSGPWAYIRDDASTRDWAYNFKPSVTCTLVIIFYYISSAKLPTRYWECSFVLSGTLSLFFLPQGSQTCATRCGCVTLCDVKHAWTGSIQFSTISPALILETALVYLRSPLGLRL